MIFATDLGDPEGPVALPDGTWLVVEGTAARGCVTQIGSDGKKKRIIQKTGLPNGLAVDRHGVIWVAESEVPSLIRLTMEGKAEVVATDCDGELFLFPNDLCFGPDGALYLTDSGIRVPDFCPGNKIRPDYMSLKYDGRVYRVDVGSGKVTLLDNSIQFTNGIAFGPDGLLYVNEMITGNIYRYGMEKGSVAGRRTLFGNVMHPSAPPGFKGPDGMAFSNDGRLYVAVFGQHDIIVLGKDGKVLERIETAGNLPTNVAFALPGSKRIAVTEYEYGQLEMIMSRPTGCPFGHERGDLIGLRPRDGNCGMLPGDSLIPRISQSRRLGPDRQLRGAPRMRRRMRQAYFSKILSAFSYSVPSRVGSILDGVVESLAGAVRSIGERLTQDSE